MVLVPFALLGASILAVWLPPIPMGGRRVALWAPLAFAALVAAWAGGLVQAPGVPPLLLLCAFCVIAASTERAWLKLLSGFLVAVLSVSLALHVVPGFRNPIVIDAIRFAPDSAPFTQYANFDKGAAGLLLLALIAPRVHSMVDARNVAARSLLAALVTVVAVLGVAVAMGYVRWGPKWPSQAWTFLIINLLLTCVAEEAFFRGFIQERLESAFPSGGFASGMAIVVSTLLFALAHVRGGSALVVLAGITGLGCSLAYAATRRIEPAILVHSAVNTVHFVGFSYPFLA